LSAGILIQTAGFERGLDAAASDAVTMPEPRAAELAPGPPNIQLTSPIPGPSMLMPGGQRRALAM
jgi:hypothetical protein